MLPETGVFFSPVVRLLFESARLVIGHSYPGHRVTYDKNGWYLL